MPTALLGVCLPTPLIPPALEWLQPALSIKDPIMAYNRATLWVGQGQEAKHRTSYEMHSGKPSGRVVGQLSVVEQNALGPRTKCIAESPMGVVGRMVAASPRGSFPWAWQPYIVGHTSTLGYTVNVL